ncbi:putative Pyrophosphate-energized vacuolar membrane proton pump [Cocos nucifera]|uniref:Putative Pyrophosphate-energized vacuolar membrane proton pump n=1 Tax=Cocos nucifera TaxID=13894 RepID=A0A8K0IR41_COCNU|nr:putative Pyrophosphate-energized vacuolar membrane proton pump [Cocos nucifera]
MGAMGDTVAQAVIPAAAVIGIVFALFQWFLVSRIRVSGDSDENNRCDDKLIEEEAEEAVDGPAVVAKCAEIQNAISIGGFRSFSGSSWLFWLKVLILS